jgi:biotin operon repressor
MKAKQFFERARAIQNLEAAMGPKAVLNCLNLRVNQSGEAWPSEETIARDIGCSERSVRSYLQDLYGKGLVILQRGGGRGVANRYRLNLPVQNTETAAGFPDLEGEPNPAESSGFSGGGGVVNPATVALNPANFALNPATVADYPPRSPKKPSGGARNKFQKPTVEQLRQFAESNDLLISEAEPFIDHYESNGWKVGRVPMRDWQATFRKWCRRAPEFKRGATGGGGAVGSPEAVAAWDSVLKAIAEHSSYEPERVHKDVGERAFAAARAAGGLRRIESATIPADQGKLNAAFIRAFEGAGP